MPTRFHLTESATHSEEFKLEIPFYHNYDTMLTEDYTVTVTLPLGSTDIKVSS